MMMQNKAGIRLLYCEMERPGNLPSYPPKQHYGLLSERMKKHVWTPLR